jgi:hypothetical protein
MRGFVLLLWLWAGMEPAAAQFDPKAPVDPAVIVLARVRLAATREFNQLPNCTCTMTVERSRRMAKRGRFELVDQLRLEVALVNGKEVYSWPGAERFEDRELVDIVRGGAIGSGEFAGHARNVLLSGSVRLDYRGEEELAGRPVYRFDYEVPMPDSRFTMRMGAVSAPVGYRGSFWADRENHQLRRLYLEIYEIPPELALGGGSVRIDYERRRLGESQFLLPAEAETTLTTVDGSESRNRTTYSNCRQYSGESSLVFEDPEELDETPAPAPVIDWKLPKDLRVTMRLAAELQAAKTAIGDTVEFTVWRDAAQRREVWLEKGARVRMRVAYLRCVDSPTAACALGLRPEAFEAGNKHGRFAALMEEPSMTAMLMQAGPRGVGQAMSIRLSRDTIPEGASLIVFSGRRLASGYQTVWRTLEVAGEKVP